LRPPDARWFLVVLAALLSAAPSNAEVTPSSSGTSVVLGASAARLSITLDDDVYLENQPIEVLVIATNSNASKAVALPSLTPAHGNLQLVLTSGDGNRLRQGGVRSIVAGPQSYLQVAGGASSTEILNLLDWFGGFSRTSGYPGWLIGQFYLPPGEYELHAALRIPTSPEPHAPSENISSNTLRFKIIRASEHPEEEAFIKNLTSDLGPSQSKWPTLRERCQKLGPAAIHSKYFMYVLQAAGLDLGVPLEALIDQLNAPGSGSRRETFVVGLIVRYSQQGDKGKQRRIEQLARRVRNDATRQVLRDLSQRINQGRFYRSLGD